MNLFDRQKARFIKLNKILLIKKQTVGLSNDTYIKLWVRVLKYHNLIRLETSAGIDLFFDYNTQLDIAINKAIGLYKAG